MPSGIPGAVMDPDVILAVVAAALLGAGILASTRLRAKNRDFHLLFTHSLLPAILLRRDGTVEELNDAFRRWADKGAALSLHDLLDHLCIESVSGSSMPARSLLLPVLESGRWWNGPLVLTSGGTVLRAEGTCQPWRSRNALLQFLPCPVVPDGRPPAALLPEDGWKDLLADSQNGIIIVRQDHVLFANPAAARFFGFAAPEAMVSANFLESVASSDHATFRFDSLDHPPGTRLLTRAEIRGLTQKGRLIDLEVDASVIRWGGVPALAVVLSEVTERKMLEREQALWQWEQEALSDIDRSIVGIADLHTIFDSILRHAVALLHADWAGILQVRNDTQCAFWRMTRGPSTGEMEDIPMDEVLAQIFRQDGQSIVRLDQDSSGAVEAGPQRLLRDGGFRSMAWAPLKVGTERVGALVAGYRTRREAEGRELRLLASLAEKTAIAMMNARQYERVVERERELERLSSARVEAQEEERRRIAREIHDGIGQMLTAIKFHLEILEDAVPAEADGQSRVADMKNLLDDLMREAREMSYTLMPGVLEDFGLAPALQMLCEQFTQKHGIPAEYQNHGLTSRLRKLLEISLYRIAQEALTNVVRHSGAAAVTVQIICSGERIRLVIEDNGKGMLLAEAPASGIGFVSMRERASQFGGTLRIDTAPGEGMVLSVDIPLKEEDHQ